MLDAVLTVYLAAASGAVGGTLGIAAASDWPTRRADNWHWWAIAALALPGALAAPTAFLTASVGLLFGLVAFYVLRFGGADAKAMMATAWWFPEPVVWLGMLGAASAGSLVWMIVRREARCPFLVPLGVAMIVGLGLQLVA